MRFVEEYRSKCMDAVFAMAGFKSCWPVWRSEISRFTTDLKNPNAIYDLGSNLRSIFQLTATIGRSQGDLSGGGASWEGLVCWYLNMVLTDTRAVVTKKTKGLTPSAVLDAISVNYGNVTTTSESDLLGLVLPGTKELEEPYSRAAFDALAASQLTQFEVHNLQCKTNWNDNAQIPMLWDMVYRAKGFKDTGVSVGRNGRSLADLSAFTYSFVTVPSQKKAFKDSHMAVKRVSGLSGGNFWGQKTDIGVAWSISEIFKKVFGDNVVGDVRQHIHSLVQNGLISLR